MGECQLKKCDGNFTRKRAQTSRMKCPECNHEWSPFAIKWECRYCKTKVQPPFSSWLIYRLGMIMGMGVPIVVLAENFRGVDFEAYQLIAMALSFIAYFIILHYILIRYFCKVEKAK